ncbi:Amidase [Penicillium cf. griseofulvum]|uniref:amidase n=1 Tax=Penicillium cf. griseofulvum TaxID=2972120 RepID=A0A9W9MGB5_9EURO|nr:Amidase [Penicillium cf. griseofulvum]KAJ5423206.1 Amidase [Penicillium cf. griseofulvum]KAJ5431522.1 Amidase [Penicillium cf. griseofulvum]
MSSLDGNVPWQGKAAKKRQECASKLPQGWKLSEQFMAGFQAPISELKNDLIRTEAIRKSGILTDRELKITEDYTVISLISALADGTLTSAEVTLAYCKRAALAQQLVSCLTETMFPEAQERAEYLDKLRAQGKLAGPLHGLPVSIKDNFHYKGTESTIGMISFLDEKSSANSPLVDILLELGAVLYVKTNIPQTMMTTDSHNNVFGRTLNPWNTTLGPGGSSGGEGALIALRGAPLGVGTDIGGSVRIPAHCCGLYGFRPSAARVPNGGMRVCTTSGMKFILSCAGPLSSDLGGIETFFRSVFDAQPARYDSTIIDIPWREVYIKPTLRIGVVPESSIFPLHPPIQRVLAEAIHLLEAQGHHIIYLDEKDCRVMEANEIAWNFFTLDQASQKHLESAGEPPVPAMFYMLKQGEKLRQFYKSSLPEMTTLDRLDKVALLNTRRAELREVYRKLWLQHNLDVCIAPPAQTTAVPHDTFGVAPYTTLTNLLDYPSCILPFGKVGELDAKESFELDGNQLGAEYNFEQLEGAPCSIQLFTTTMRDEECLQIAKQIDQCLKSDN